MIASPSISRAGNGRGETKAVPEEEQQVSMESVRKEPLAQNLMEIVTSRDNLNEAYKRVKSNKGSGGVDGMSVDGLSEYIKSNKEEIVNALLDGSYQPMAVRGVEIPKPKGGKRQLGIPTVLDRVIQQAIHQVLEPIFEPLFSNSSYGFRPRRNAHQALDAARAYVASGREWVVDIDLAKFFDQVNHDILMSRLARVIGDKILLKLIRKFLQAGMMSNGVVIERRTGTPQGGPLSPLLSNIMLNELDKELEKRGHTFCRYADDCNIYVSSKEAGDRVMQSIKQFLATKLRLEINEDKSAVAMVSERQFLGYRIEESGYLVISPNALQQMKNKVRQITRRSRGISFETVLEELNRYLSGWHRYFSLHSGSNLFKKLDQWIRRRLRCFRLKQRKRPKSVIKYLVTLGLSESKARRLAMSGKGWWRKSCNPNINIAMPIEWFNKLGLVRLYNKSPRVKSSIKTAVCDIARTVV